MKLILKSKANRLKLNILALHEIVNKLDFSLPTKNFLLALDYQSKKSLQRNLGKLFIKNLGYYQLALKYKTIDLGFYFAKRKGNIVITSHKYLPKEQISFILDILGVQYNPIFLRHDGYYLNGIDKSTPLLDLYISFYKGYTNEDY